RNLGFNGRQYRNWNHGRQHRNWNNRFRRWRLTSPKYASATMRRHVLCKWDTKRAHGARFSIHLESEHREKLMANRNEWVEGFQKNSSELIARSRAGDIDGSTTAC